MIKLEREFSQALHGSILEGLETALGESGMKVVLSNIELTQCVDNLGELQKNLRNIFKDGAITLEKMIVKELFRRLSLPYEERADFDFEGYINHAKGLFETQQETESIKKAANRRSRKRHVILPHLKIVKTLWQNTSVQISYVVVDLNNGQEYPQNFLCVFPMNLFRRNQKSNLKRSKFHHVFGEKTHEIARKLLTDALRRETGVEVRRQIEASLRDINEVYPEQFQEVPFPH